MVVVVVIIAVLAVVGLAVLLRSVGQRKGQWERIWVADDHWRLVNHTGATALEVKVEVRGHGIRSVDANTIHEIEDGASADFLTAVDLEATGGDPLVAVSWLAQGRSRRRLWAAPLKS
ncbi:MAG: hypothetical protein JWM89_4010 [Acidimicrobiales bacterium]|nr:hypothetical protein [Acidimicrobiales bacterium]